ncbi:hypothetical protein AVEN_199715-1 [Araneus ventricosus]|uniref:Uncharacterized protein n=1 Tax=Araneus ventricosus TaxID=182803 RepID=A0A4Y2L5L0_ARAVE|nr:hypothetical protein AVEN_199715-1 [Araneus ventricosus]
MESFLAYPRERKKAKHSRGGKKELDKTLGYLGVVNAVTPEEDVPLVGRSVGWLGIYWRKSQMWPCCAKRTVNVQHIRCAPEGRRVCRLTSTVRGLSSCRGIK